MSDAHRGLPTGTDSPKSSAANPTKPIVSGGTVVQPKGVGVTPATMSRPNSSNHVTSKHPTFERYIAWQKDSDTTTDTCSTKRKGSRLG